MIMLCGHALAGIHRLYHDQFNRDAANNPWVVVTKSTEDGNQPAATRDQVYRFPARATAAGHPEAAGVICSRDVACLVVFDADRVWSGRAAVI